MGNYSSKAMYLNILRKLTLAGLMAYAFIPALERKSQVDLCEFKARLVYIENSRPARIKW